MRRHRNAALAALAGLFAAAAWGWAEPGDRRGSILPDPESAMIVALSGDDVEFTWESKVNRTYVILAADRASDLSAWRPIPGLEPVQGTGRRISIKLRIPNAQQYRYSLRTYAPDARRRWRR